MDTSYYQTVGSNAWRAILLIIIIVGARNLVRAPGPKWRKRAYMVISPLISFALTLGWGGGLGSEYALNYPVTVMFEIMIILHLVLNRPIKIWVQEGFLPFSNQYPQKEDKDWRYLASYEKMFRIGLLISVFSLTIVLPLHVWLAITKSVLFWLGIVLMVLSKSIQHSEKKLLIGFIPLLVGIIIIPVNQVVGAALFYPGAAIVIWSLISIRKKRSVKLIEAESDTKSS